MQNELALGGDNVQRMKWVSKVRLEQAQMPAASKVLNREEVVNDMVREAVEKAEEVVRSRFAAIAAERGFLEGEELEAREKAKALWLL